MESYQAIYDAVRSRIGGADIGEAISSAIRNADIGHHASMAGYSIQCAAELYTRPSAVYRPRLFIDGANWCALYGENMQDGVCGFGASPEAAMADFDKHWAQTLQH